MKKVNVSSLFVLQMIENDEYIRSLLESAYPRNKLEKELNRNLEILNFTVLEMDENYIELSVNFSNPDDISIGGE